MEPRTKLGTILLLHQFCMTLLSERGESHKRNETKSCTKLRTRILCVEPLGFNTTSEMCILATVIV